MPLKRLALLFSLALVLVMALGYLLLRNLVILPYVNDEVLATQQQEVRGLMFQIEARQQALALLAQDMASDDHLMAYLSGRQVQHGALPLRQGFTVQGLFLYDATLTLRYQDRDPQFPMPMLLSDDPFQRAKLMPMLDPHHPRASMGVLLQGGLPFLYAAATVCSAMGDDCGHGYLMIVRRMGEDFRDRLAQTSGLNFTIRPATLEDDGLPELLASDQLVRPKAERDLLVRDALGRPTLVMELSHTTRPPNSITRYEWLTFVALAVMLVVVNLIIGQMLVRPMERGVAQIRAMERNQQFRPLGNGANITEFRQLANAFNSLMRMLAQQREQLSQLARTDALTGLPNRRAMEEFLDEEWRRLCRHQRGLALMMVDIDHFKQFNDHFGHGTGDEVLAKVARVLESVTRRGGELASRWGGEEFVLAITEPKRDELERLAEVVAQRIGQLPISASGISQRLTVSIGIAFVPAGQDPVALGLNLNEMMEQADRALYRVKSAGRDGIELWCGCDTMGPHRP
ncbi:sensor domain-containing diguanylate cyclase [Ferrimonas balearica]|uniref:sensor domain-containing diguanylate cyclase n=1 Tax=Ferrimonas balearica TaxID=44012 RepID=UPI001C5666AF|nr:diguanylate cyclase [Ferrimonas balearica]MBW3164825.1 diguanylate cyclase [Ferrimonas balearica]MBY5980309.1 diguanylate cyclase [Ferrimonas balearica]MBY6107091.1 diguanylate cyclase [Ferrimonas balearica]